MKTLLLAITIVFLFGGIYMVGVYSKAGEKIKNVYDVQFNYSRSDKDYSMKQIDYKTSKLNYPFTSVNEKGISPYSIR